MLRAALLVILGATLALPSVALAATWLLYDEYGDARGSVELDLATPAILSSGLEGDFGAYARPSRIFLGGTEFVGPERVVDYMSAFSDLTGRVFREDYGPGDYTEERINESKIEIGTLGGSLAGATSPVDVIINEVFNVSRTTATCAAYEELYDEQGNYLGEGDCLYSYFSYERNSEEGYHYYGTLVAAVASVPIPASLGALLLGCLGLALAARGRRA